MIVIRNTRKEGSYVCYAFSTRVQDCFERRGSIFANRDLRNMCFDAFSYACVKRCTHLRFNDKQVKNFPQYNWHPHPHVYDAGETICNPYAHVACALLSSYYHLTFL